MVNCKTHPDANLINDPRAGDLICPECGVVVGERVIDVTTEWRSFSNEHNSADPSRVGAPENIMLSSDLSTCISFQYKTGPNPEHERLATLQSRTVSSSDRQMLNAINLIRGMAQRIHLAGPVETSAIEVFKDVQKSSVLKGKNAEAQAAACLYIACRKQGVPRTFKEICAVSSVSKKEIGRCFKKIAHAMQESLAQISSTDYMGRFCGNLGLSVRAQTVATHIAKRCVELDLVAGKSPISVAAAAIYMATFLTKEHKSAKEIGLISGAAEVTVRHTYKILYFRAREIIPADIALDVELSSLPLM